MYLQVNTEPSLSKSNSQLATKQYLTLLKNIICEYYKTMIRENSITRFISIDDYTGTTQFEAQLHSYILFYNSAECLP